MANFVQCWQSKIKAEVKYSDTILVCCRVVLSESMKKELNTNIVINIGFSIVILILGIMTGANMYIINQNNEAISNINLKQQQAQDTFIMRNAAQQRALILFQMTVMDDVFDRDDMYIKYNKEALNFNLAFSHLKETIDSDTAADLKLIQKLAGKGRKIQDKAAELIYVEDMEAANKILFSEVIPVQTKVMAKLTSQREKQQSYLNNKIEYIRQLNIKAYWTITIAGILAIILGLAIAIYVSRHNKRTSKLELEKQMAEEANIAKSEFLANMSHELRTPVHAILSFSKFGLVKKNASREKIHDYFQHIQDSGKRLISLLTDLLDLEKLESRKVNYNFRDINIQDEINICIDGLSSLLEDKNISVKLHSIGEASCVECDPALIHQVFENLLSNAIKFSESNSEINIYIEKVTSRRGKNVFRFSIKDEGIGIPDKELELVFDKFIQSSHTNTGSGGTGLGLAICAEIIAGHGGHIWAERVEKGAMFMFEIPVKQPQPF